VLRIFLACALAWLAQGPTDPADVGEPVAEGAAAMSLALVGEGEVVVRVGVLRDEGDGALVGGDGVRSGRLSSSSTFAEVEEGEGVLGVGLGGAAVELLGHGDSRRL